MATYKFEQFNTEIVDPTITVLRVNDSIGQKTCSVEVLLTTDNGSKFGLTLDGLVYSDTWEDADAIAWANMELDKHDINKVGLKSKVEEPVKVIKPSLWKRIKNIFKRK